MLESATRVIFHRGNWPFNICSATHSHQPPSRTSGLFQRHPRAQGVWALVDLFPHLGLPESDQRRKEFEDQHARSSVDAILPECDPKTIDPRRDAATTELHPIPPSARRKQPEFRSRLCVNRANHSLTVTRWDTKLALVAKPKTIAAMFQRISCSRVDCAVLLINALPTNRQW